MSSDVIRVDPQGDARWEALVSRHPDALVYHHPAWLAVIERAYRYEVVGLAREGSGGELRGILPLVLRRGLITGRRLSSMPHTPVAGPLAEDDASAAALLDAALARARGDSRLTLEIKAPRRLEGAPAELTEQPSDARYILELPERVEDVRFGNSRNHGRIKWSVNKAAREGVAVRPAESVDDLRAWYRLYLETVRAHGVPPRPYAFFRALWELLRPRGLMRLLLAEREEAGGRRLVAGSVLLMAGQTVFYVFNGRRREDLALRPNDVIQWHAIHDACASGYRRYDMGRVEERQQGLAEFKGKWGAEPQPLYLYSYPPSDGRERAVFDPDHPLRKSFKAAWQHVPLGATRLADRLYRYL